MPSTISRAGRRRAAGAVIAASAFALVAPGSALGADAVFGGSTSAGQAIVLKADKKAKRLKSMVVAWTAECDDGRRFPVSFELTATRAEPGFTPDSGDLATSRNGNGRFAGTQLGGGSAGESAAVMTATYSGKLAGRRASGTLSGEIRIVELASGQQQALCSTGSVRWSATRAPGRVFAGRTSQEQPIVLRLDKRRAKIADLLVGWESSTCEPPDRFLQIGERFSGFPMKAGRFGDAFEQSYPGSDGGSFVVSYEVDGRVARTVARGTYRARVTERDAAGATMASCDSGGIAWSAATG